MLAKRNDVDREFGRTGYMVKLLRDFFDGEPFWSNKPLFPNIPFEKELALVNYMEPLTDIVEGKDQITAKMEIPGLEKEDIKISATKDGIEIKAEKKDEVKEEDRKKGRYRIERSYSGFYRSFTLPESADIEKIGAEYKNGILELKIPKKAIEQKKQTEVKVK